MGPDTADSYTTPPAGRNSAGVIVVLDTDPGVRWALERGLQKSGYEVASVSTVAEALSTASDQEVACIIIEILPEAGLNLEALSLLLESPGAPRVICVSVDSAPQLVIDCMRRGAADFLPKPFTLAEVRAAVSRALGDRSADSNSRIYQGPARGPSDPSLLIGISPAIQELRAVIKQVAQTDLNCLLRGESGTGKDMVAREIHRMSKRSDKPFVKVNCTALPEQLLESELFGFEKGAFTGAVSSKPGRFELAHRGIIFLDEIGDMHPSLQAKLLQVIEHKEFTKLGGQRHVRVDVQIIAATNANLEQKTKEGSFRGDLYFRLNEVCIWVPPLSARKEDVPLLVRHFLQKHGRYTADGDTRISAEDLEDLTNHSWPGNVRELESTIKRWLALGKSPLGGAKPSAPVNRRREEVPLNPAAQPSAVVDDVSEIERIRTTLDRYQWNRRKAAEALGMSYQTLRRRIEQYELDQRT